MNVIAKRKIQSTALPVLNTDYTPEQSEYLERYEKLVSHIIRSAHDYVNRFLFLMLSTAELTTARVNELSQQFKVDTLDVPKAYREAVAAVLATDGYMGIDI